MLVLQSRKISTYVLFSPSTNLFHHYSFLMRLLVRLFIIFATTFGLFYYSLLLVAISQIHCFHPFGNHEQDLNHQLHDFVNDWWISFSSFLSILNFIESFMTVSSETTASVERFYSHFFYLPSRLLLYSSPSLEILLRLSMIFELNLGLDDNVRNSMVEEGNKSY